MLTRFLLFCLAVLLASGPAFADSVYTVNVDTSSLLGTSAQLAFDLIDGGGSSNTVTLTDFSTDGTLGSVFPTGLVSGALPGTVTLADSPGSFFNEYLTDMTLGTTFSFTLDATTNGPDPLSVPDALSVFLLDPSTGLPLYTTSDPTGSDSLLTLNIDGTPEGDLGVYASTVGAAIAGSGSASTVPEPHTAVLLAGGFVFLVWRLQRSRPHRRKLS
ncbi:MAG TPA: NF038129 family PEP-CTERM protein [Bryobacteraceae bacterium]|nr:NF038129 family PEP-CTERM protein [Bryobacteraceae bacterium]HUO29615.1 NF038129 family PEP-CTERM protein [Bryobacteraceae bacterium]